MPFHLLHQKKAEMHGEKKASKGNMGFALGDGRIPTPRVYMCEVSGWECIVSGETTHSPSRNPALGHMGVGTRGISETLSAGSN